VTKEENSIFEHQVSIDVRE